MRVPVLRVMAAEMCRRQLTSVSSGAFLLYFRTLCRGLCRTCLNLHHYVHRLAKQLLARISSSGNAHAGDSDGSSSDDSDDDALDNAAKRGVLGVAPARDAVTRALRMQAQAAAGAVYRRLAADVRTALKGRGVTGSSLPLVDRSAVTAYRGHKVWCK